MSVDVPAAIGRERERLSGVGVLGTRGGGVEGDDDRRPSSRRTPSARARCSDRMTRARVSSRTSEVDGEGREDAARRAGGEVTHRDERGLRLAVEVRGVVVLAEPVRLSRRFVTMSPSS